MLTIGGAQKLLALLSAKVPQNLYKTIICALQPNDELRPQLESYGARVVCFDRPRPSIINPLQFLSYIYLNIRDIMKLCRQEKVDIIQCHLSDAEFLGTMAGYLAGVKPIIATAHYPEILPVRHIYDPRNFLRKVATNIIYSITDHVIAVSDDIAQRLQTEFSFHPQKLKVIINRIDVESYQQPASDELRSSLGLSSEVKIITTVARLMPPKGHEYLIKAMYNLVQKNKMVKLLLVGDGLLKDQLITLCETLGIKEQVLFLGNRSDIVEILALTDVFVLPSLWEGTSLALLEAMAAGRPIVATDIPGNRAVVQNKVSGLLVKPGDAMELFEAVDILLHNPATAQLYGQRARAIACSRFDINQSIAELERLWRGPFPESF